MLSRWPIRDKLLIGLGLLLVIVGCLSASGIVGLYNYRALVKSLSDRAAELRPAAELGREAGELRLNLSKRRALAAMVDSELEAALTPAAADPKKLEREFREGLRDFRQALARYRLQLGAEMRHRSQINDRGREWADVEQIETLLAEIERLEPAGQWQFDDETGDPLGSALTELHELTAELPSHLHERIHDLAGGVRLKYRTLIVLTWFTTLATALFLAVFVRLFYTWVFRPLRLLVKGSRRVAAGDFDYRIRLDSRDEMAELAEALNDMTARFQEIRGNLDYQVQEQTRQIVRSEQLASVGFLAAGVAHEINNPLASIALCAESLEGRLADELPADSPQQGIVRQYLQMIQTEAFRCKEITGKLLDFSRAGSPQREPTELRELVQSVTSVIKHLDKYHDRQVTLLDGPPVVAPVSAPQIKQVVLNLITNGLDSVEPGGQVNIEVRARRGMAELVFTDNGCGMTDEVREHLFEPFFTRRRSGQGTGLGLSISYRIVADHGGYIEATSEGPGRGSQFRVGLPLAVRQKETGHRHQAA